jgi:Tol biopolymer transport system component
MQALTPNSPNSQDSPTEPAADLLPHSLYFINNDNAGIAQVFRLEADGKTLTQITFEPTAISSYDVSQVDGSVAYVSNNQILLINADSSGRRVLVNGGPQDEINPFVNEVRYPVFSPNGETIAYGYKGLNLYAVDTGITDLVLEDELDDLGNGAIFPRELFWPNQYSPDGTKLLITLGYYEGASSAIYYPAANSLVRLNGGEGGLICCDATQWTADGSAFYSASPSAGLFDSGLWRVDASNGNVTTLFTSNYETSSFNYASEPFLAPDGQLYFFFYAVNSELNERARLQLVRSAPDGVTGRTVLRPESFQLMNEALWPPDASFVVVANAPSEQIYRGGALELYYTDATQNTITLAPFGQQLKWGP